MSHSITEPENQHLQNCLPICPSWQLPSRGGIRLLAQWVPWFLTTLQNYGDPQPDPEIELIVPFDEAAISRGKEMSVVVKLKNTGSTPITDLQASFQSRVDLETHAPSLPKVLGLGEAVELKYGIVGPSQINVQCVYNRVAYAHWSALYRRAKKVHFAHVPVRVSLTE